MEEGSGKAAVSRHQLGWAYFTGLCLVCFAQVFAWEVGRSRVCITLGATSLPNEIDKEIDEIGFLPFSLSRAEVCGLDVYCECVCARVRVRVYVCVLGRALLVLYTIP